MSRSIFPAKAGIQMTYNRPEHIESHEVIGHRYLIARRLREEPWGEVWLAQDNVLKTEVSLKLLSREAPDWSRARDMFEHAAILGLKLRHPQILGVFHVDKAERFLYLVEEPFPGETLLAYLARHPRLKLAQALDLLELLSEALAYAHELGEVHQSISPLNILFNGDDVRLANFAFAPAYDDTPLHLELKAYTPPEVILGDRLTPAGNVFALGVLGFRLVAGSLPYALTFDEAFPYRLEYPPVDLEEIPVPLQNVLLRCLSEDPEERLPHAAALASQLRQARDLMHEVSKKPQTPGRFAKSPLAWQPLAQAGPLLKKVWEGSKPQAQKAKEAALAHWSTLKRMPRRLWWGLGLAALAVILIFAGTKMRRPTAPPPAPLSAAAPVTLLPMTGGPPLMEAGEAAAPREPAARPGGALGPGAAAATPAESGREASQERYLVLAATLGTMKQAEALQQRLRAKNFRAVIVTRKTGGKTLYQVQVGPLTGAKAAEDAASRIKSQEKLTPTVMKVAGKTTAANQTRRPTR
jgi:serine/threonine-protein kinase